MPPIWGSTPTALAPTCPPPSPDSKRAIDPAAINALEACLQQLPEYRGWNADQTHSETSDLVRSLLATIGRPCNTNLLDDGTLTSPRRYLELLPRLKQLGYRTFIVQVTVPESVSRQRVLQR